MTFPGPYPSTPVASYASGAWDANQVREHGAAIYDPVTDQWIFTYSALDVLDDAAIGAALSDDGETWTPHPDNPITGTVVEAEDPYIAKTIDGEVYRDASGRALMFTEDEPSAARAVDLWRSAPNTLDGWTRFGRVLDKGGAGTWEDQDVGSPVIIHDGTQLVMLYEGRSSEQEGEIGVAISDDDGETWTKSPDNPIITRPGSGWNERSIVTDDIIKVGDDWILLVHAISDTGAFFTVGRYSTTDDPADWTDGSFTEMAGNPYDIETNTAMCHGNDPGRVVWIGKQAKHIYMADIIDV